MSHIFISYSHKDTVYVHKLRQALIDEGFEVWIDDRIEYGDEWPLVIQEHLDSCGAFILVASENSFRSKWVQKEMTRAERIGKRLFPLLLSGQPWLSIESTQYVDVTDRSLPTERYYKRLESAVPRKKTSSPPLPPPPPEESLWSKVFTGVKNFFPRLLPFLKVTGMFAFVAVVIWGSALLIPYLRSLVSTTTPEPTATTASISNPVATSSKTEITDEKDVQMVFVSAGEFTMGRDKAFTNEGPAHRVKLDAFYIDKLEVTNALYRVCDEQGDCPRPTYTSPYYEASRSDHPVVYVTWEMAKTYCEWRGARLPTEAEWEKAARGTDERLYPWGPQEPIVQYANYKGTDSKPVRSYSSIHSPYEALNLAGNVAEWVSDWYSPDYYQTVSLETIFNPTGPVVSPYQTSHNFYGRVVRGGSWSSTENHELSTTYRNHVDPKSQAIDLGFRCAKDAP